MNSLKKSRAYWLHDEIIISNPMTKRVMAPDPSELPLPPSKWLLSPEEEAGLARIINRRACRKALEAETKKYYEQVRKMLQDSNFQDCIGCESGADCPQSHTCKMP